MHFQLSHDSCKRQQSACVKNGINISDDTLRYRNLLVQCPWGCLAAWRAKRRVSDNTSVIPREVLGRRSPPPPVSMCLSDTELSPSHRNHFREDPRRRSSTKEEERAMVGPESPSALESCPFVLLLEWIGKPARSINSMKRISVLVFIVICSDVMIKPITLLPLSKCLYPLHRDLSYVLFLCSLQEGVF